MQVTTKLQQTPHQSFQALKYDKKLTQEIVKQTIEQSKALQKFGKKYNANIDYIQLSANKNEIHPAFLISNIIPRGIQKIIDKIKHINSKNQFIYISTRGTKNEDLHKKLTSVSENYLIKKYQKAFSTKQQEL